MFNIILLLHLQFGNTINNTLSLLSSLLFLEASNLAYIKISSCKINLSTKNNLIPLKKYIINPFGQEILLKVPFEAGYEPFSSHYLARNNQNCSRAEHYILHSVSDAKLQLLIFGMRTLQVKFDFRLILI